jgi:PhoPQ-activated pathogenicity-related protein
VGFPTSVPERDFVYQVRVPKYFVHSTHDEFGPQPELAAFFETLPEPKQLTWVPAQDHFFKDALDAYEVVIEKIGRARS